MITRVSPYVISTSISAFTIQAGKYAAEKRTGRKNLKGTTRAQRDARMPRLLQRGPTTLAILFFATSGVTLKGYASEGLACARFTIELRISNLLVS